MHEISWIAEYYTAQNIPSLTFLDNNLPHIPSTYFTPLNHTPDKHGVIKKSAPDDYSTHKTDDLKMVITEDIRNVDRAIRNTVFENTVRRVSKCLETGGGHFDHYLQLSVL